MSELILLKFIANEECSVEELEELSIWLEKKQRNKSNKKDFFSLKWDHVKEKDVNLRFVDILSKLKNEIQEKGKPKPSKLRNLYINYQRIAAIFLIPIILFSGFYIYTQSKFSIEYFQTTAANGQKSQVVLPDGTKVWLNSGSRLKYPSNFGGKKRMVSLQGEGYFEVIKNGLTPFIVEAGHANITVLGTTFNIKAYGDEDEIETSLFEGKINLTIPSSKNEKANTIVMKPGEAIVFNKSKKSVRYSQMRTDEISGWKNNQLIFKDDSFENLVKKVERWYDVEIIYDSAALKNQRLTVELYEGELLNNLLEILEVALSVNCEINKNKIYIKSTKMNNTF